MHRNHIIILLLAGMLAGCVSAPSPAKLPHGTITQPAEGMLLQRAVLTIHGREFSLNGYVVRSETQGLRLIMTENFGGVLADVLVKPDGKIFVMQAKAPFRPAWIEKYIAADLKCIFGMSTDADCPVQMVSATHFVVDRRQYKLDLRTIEARPRPQPPELFDETRRSKP
jgi:hypothetical protein